MFRSVMMVVTLATSLLAAAAPAGAADPTSRIVYGGKVEDGQGRPIGGIYPLTFSFYRTAKGGRAVWTESHFVAVDNGVYAVELGRDKALPKTLDLDKAFLGVAITGGKEIVRDRFVTDPSLLPAPVTPVTPSKPEPGVGAPPQPVKGSYADLAGFAYEAEKAKNSEAIGGMTLAELRALIKQSAPEAGGKEVVAKVKIGDAKRFTEPAGGLGGQPFTLQCPAGFVVTGIRGQAAGYVDQISVICSPLE